MRPRGRVPCMTALLGGVIVLLGACQVAPPESTTDPHVEGGTDVERGRYVTIIGGCNDCHTDGYLDLAP